LGSRGLGTWRLRGSELGLWGILMMLLRRMSELG